jgi:hypothetical protein
MIRKQFVNALLAGMFMAVSAQFSVADGVKNDQNFPPEKYLSKGMKEFTISGGIGGKLPLHRFDDRDNTHFVSVVPSVGYFIKDKQELVLEAPILYYDKPQHAMAAGVDLMYRYYFTRNRKFSPFIELGAGANYVGLDIRDLTGKFQFSLQGGVGVRRKISDRGDVVVSLRWHHFSNAGTRAPNIGTNDSFLLIGYSHYF